ncbi:MAG: TonB family protein, partial [Myxococcota bacterium]
LRRRRQAKLRNNTILKHITAAGVGGSAGPDALRQGHAERLSDAFKPAGGITVGKPGDVAGFRGGPKLEGEGGTARGTRVATLSKSERGAGRLKTGTVKTTTKKPEKRVKLRVGLRGGRKSGGIGKLDGSVVTKVLKRRSTAFRACYESRLKVNPGLSGKVVIKFTIGPAGRITNIKATSNSTGDTAVAQCIVNKVKRFRFNPPENGSVTFTYPIVLSKG